MTHPEVKLFWVKTIHDEQKVIWIKWASLFKFIAIGDHQLPSGQIIGDLRPFGMGAGISMYFYRSTRNTITFTDFNLTNNKAIYGGMFFFFKNLVSSVDRKVQLTRCDGVYKLPYKSNILYLTLQQSILSLYLSMGFNEQSCLVNLSWLFYDAINVSHNCYWGIFRWPPLFLNGFFFFCVQGETIFEPTAIKYTTITTDMWSEGRNWSRWSLLLSFFQFGGWRLSG